MVGPRIRWILAGSKVEGHVEGDSFEKFLHGLDVLLLAAKMTKGGEQGLGQFFEDKFCSEAGPSDEMAAPDGSDEGGGDGAKRSSMEETGEVSQCLGTANSARRFGQRRLGGRFGWGGDNWGQVDIIL